MANPTLHRIDLSARVHSVSDAVDALQRTLRAQRVTQPVVDCLERLREEILALRAAVGLNNNTISPNMPPVVNQLSQTAVATLWDEVPLQLLADAHRRNAETFVRYGQSDDQVYVECQKYLLLHPTKNGNDFSTMAERASRLAQRLARGA